jgi:hypothetical protein
MKRIVLVLSAFLITAITCTAQETTQPVLNKSNRIILHFDDTTGIFTKLGRILVDRGYDIDFKDRELGVLRTKARVWSTYNYSYAEIKTIFRDSTVTIYAASRSQDYVQAVRFTQIKGFTKVTTNSAWVEMMNIADLLKPASISYSRFE